MTPLPARYASKSPSSSLSGKRATTASAVHLEAVMYIYIYTYILVVHIIYTYMMRATTASAVHPKAVMYIYTHTEYIHYIYTVRIYIYNEL